MVAAAFTAANSVKIMINWRLTMYSALKNAIWSCFFNSSKRVSVYITYRQSGCAYRQTAFFRYSRILKRSASLSWPAFWQTKNFYSLIIKEIPAGKHFIKTSRQLFRSWARRQKSQCSEALTTLWWFWQALSSCQIVKARSNLFSYVNILLTRVSFARGPIKHSGLATTFQYVSVATPSKQ